MKTQIYDIHVMELNRKEHHIYSDINPLLDVCIIFRVTAGALQEAHCQSCLFSLSCRSSVFQLMCLSTRSLCFCKYNAL